LSAVDEFINECINYFASKSLKEVGKSSSKRFVYNRCIIQLYQNLLPSIERSGKQFLALRLVPLAKALGKESMLAGIRSTLKQLYKESYRGIQFFLSPEALENHPIRSKAKNNTKSCNFIAHDDNTGEVVSGKN